MSLTPPWEFNNPLCAEIGLDLYYRDEENEDDYSRVHGEQAKAKRLCKECDHLFDCAEWGINREKWGVWGGLTPKERTNIRRSRRRKSKSLSQEINLLP